ARPGLLQQNAQLGDHLLRCAGDDHHLLELPLQIRTGTRADRAADGGLDEAAAILRTVVARRRAPYRVRQAGELALHPQELARVLQCLLLGLGDVDLLQQAVVFRAAGKPGLGRLVIVHLPDLVRPLDRGVERDIRIAVLRRPDDRLFADDAGNPDTRV